MRLPCLMKSVSNCWKACFMFAYLLDKMASRGSAKLGSNKGTLKKIEDRPTCLT